MATQKPVTTDTVVDEAKADADEKPEKTVKLTSPGGAKVVVGESQAEELKAHGYK